MKSISVMDTYWDLKRLYQEAAASKARRGLFGYMLKTGRTDNTIFGGAFKLVCDLEDVPKHSAYKLKIESASGKEIIAAAEVALAGGFDQFAPPIKEIKKTCRALKNIDIN